MTLNALQALTWSTVTGAVVGALLLASIETNFTESSRARRTESSTRTTSAENSIERMAPERAPVLIETSARRELAVR